MKEAVKGFLRKVGAMRTTVIAGKEIDQPRMPFRQIAQYEGLPVIYPDGTPCYDLPEDAVLHMRGSLKIGENLQAAYVYMGKIRREWPHDTQ